MKDLQIKRKQNKYEIEVRLSFSDLIDILPLEAECASADIELSEKQSLTYRIIEGDLYGYLAENKDQGMLGQKEVWWFFDNSCRRWQKCDDPFNS